jgi:hypothetical protein
MLHQHGANLRLEEVNAGAVELLGRKRSGYQ